MKKMIRAFSVIITIISLTACQEVVRSVDSNDITGIYYLLKVDGAAIPGTVTHDGETLEISSGTFFISDDGTCLSSTRFTKPSGDEMTREVRAQYEVNDSRLTMKWEGAGTTEGAVEGDRFTMDNHGMIFEYTRNP